MRDKGIVSKAGAKLLDYAEKPTSNAVLRAPSTIGAIIPGTGLLAPEQKKKNTTIKPKK
jgi:hypothetical protein